MEGYVYHLRNDAMPGLAKLGFSGNVSNRMKSLCTTGVPMMFDCIYAKKVKNMKQAESFLFIDLAHYRFNPNREFFKVDDEIIKASFDKIEGEYIDISTFNKNYIRESIKSEKTNITDNINNKMEYCCKRCGYITQVKCNFKKHLEKTNICPCLLEDISRDLLLIDLFKKYNDITSDCEFCNKKFNSISNLSRHRKICIKKDTITILQNTVNELRNFVKKSNSATNNTQNITNNTQNINITIPKLNNFGNENMEALPESLVSTLFMDLRFRELMANLHCDPNYPENQNVRIKSIKRNTMEIFRNNKWDIMTFTNGLTELLLQGHKIFKDYYKKDKDRILEEDMSEDEIKEVLDKLEQIEKVSKDELKPLLVDLQMMLEEYRENGSAIISI
jgi:hypothetical protein